MAESMLSVCWKNHTSELATVYASLLENNFLVDCTISAEGQSLKAHRLVLSACSPYFHMLFRQETGKHPFVIFLEASFETLKAVIDFVYRGETQVPEGNLKAFLTLAQSLQIKGLNAFYEDNKNKNLTNSTTENDSPEPSENNEDTCEAQSIDASPKDRPENHSQQHRHSLGGYTGAETTNSSVPFEGYRAKSQDVWSTSLITPMQELHRPPDCNEESVNMQVTMKPEPLYTAFSEITNEMLNNVRSGQTMSENFTSKIDGGTAAVCSEANGNVFTTCGESSRGNMESSILPPSHQQLMQLSAKVSSSKDVAQEDEHLPPVILIPKSEHVDDEIFEESMDYPDVPENDMIERVEETEPACGEQNLDQGSRADRLRPESDLATPQQGGMQLWSRGAQGKSLLPALREGPRAPKRQPSGEEPVLSCVDREVFPSSSSLPSDNPTPGSIASQNRRRKKERPFSCDVCGASFAKRNNLVDHIRTHTGERPYRCDLCGNSFVQVQHLSRHKLTHTGERPYPCGLCGRAYREKQDLSRHIRSHTGERPFPCDICGKAFNHKPDLVSHTRTHTGERPYPCDVCGVAFAKLWTLSKHKRTHMGDQTYR